MKKSFYGILCVLLVITLLPITTFAEQKPIGAANGEIVTVIVEVKGDSILDSQNIRDLGYKSINNNDAKMLEKRVRAAQTNVQSAIKSTLKEDAPVLFTYTHVFNGFAIKIAKKDIEKIKALPNVEKVYLDSGFKIIDGEEQSPIRAEETSQAEHKLNLGSEMMNLEYMHDRGFTGKGLVIAVVDGSFDVNHIMFSEPVSNPRLSKSDISDLIKNNSLSISGAGAMLSANRVYRSEKIPFAFNYATLSADTYVDNEDHGVHVAGIAAGNHGIDLDGNIFVGAAPDAQLLLMSCTAGTGRGLFYDSALLAGMEDAVKLGADIINCSFGAANNYSDTPVITAVNTARNAGIMVSIAAGNDSRGYGGPIPADIIDYSTLSRPTDVSAATSVASADNTSNYETFYVFETDGNKIHYNSMNDEVSFCDTLQGNDYEYIYAGKGFKSDFENIDISGKIALLDYGDIPFLDKSLNAQNAGAVAVVISYKTIQNITMSQSDDLQIPVAVISEDDIDKLIGAENKKITVLGGLRNEVVYNPNIQMSEFSSWDTERNLELKPEITAPGGNIYSSINDDNFGFKSGTSMATPFFAGASALLMEYMSANPDKYATQGNRVTLLENLFMSTADVIIQDNENGIPYSPRLQGAGLANVEKAAKTPVILLGDEFTADGYTYQKSKISLRSINLDDNNTFSVSFTARNITNVPVTYDSLSMKVITDSADEFGYIGDMRELSFSANLPESVTVPANGDVTLEIPVTLDKEDLDENAEVFTNGFYIDGYVFLYNSDDSIPMLNIPFTGFYGDWNAQPTLDGYIFDDNLLSGTYLYTSTNRLPDGDYDSEYNEYKLGYNLFNEYDSYFSGKEYAGISPNFDGEADDLCAVFMPLRMTGKTDFAICDKSGNELMRDADGTDVNYYFAGKYMPSYLGFSKDELIDLPDGDYVFKIYAGFRYKEPYEQDEEIEMPFYIDRKAPQIIDFSISDDGSELNLTISDNRYLMGIVVSGMSDGNKTFVSYPVMAQKEYTTTIDVSEFDKSSISVEVYDYAYNKVTVSNCPPEFEYNERNGTEFSFTVHNFSGKEIPCTLVLGLYLKGNLVGLTSKEETIKSGTSHKYFNLDCDVYDTVKLFTWENFKSMKPICNNFEF